ncbi:hypothetical protein CKM354_000089100 [Cercospora kikuchii]|uniref:Uncharacterized protein n=1 Tax=Cercospora kikuchii TaxID=84275 RepID=A0A9P3CBR2_9PEZI|nr:uncharacterized protein CKM354_000089100 [Cercospora kikuchii]GIZ37445.1 hypothetical protein CKM354_000089100 [Cercospora kikuchii]
MTQVSWYAPELAAAADCKPNADIAGPGVVWSFLISAFVATILSWCRIFSKTPGIPLTDIELTRPSSAAMLAKHPMWFRRSDRLHRAVQDAISNLGLTQLITSLALLISTLVIYSDSYNDPHALLAFALTLLATSSHVAPRAALVKTNKTRIRPLFPRCVLFLSEHLAFTIYFLRRRVAEDDCPFWTIRIVLLVCGAVLWVCIAANMVICIWRPKDDIPVLYARLVEVGAYISIVVGTAVTVAMTATALYLVYGQKACDMLKGQGDSMWSFGQYLAILMLLVPALSFVEHLIGDRDADCEDVA